jgi:cytochrome c oxidase assembly protein subunit 15
MMRSILLAEALPYSTAMRRRHLFTRVTLCFTVVLLAWGAVVTSIEAGLAVPDWPTSFKSMDPLNPLPGWWAIPSILAEHGHRLMGMIVGACTLILSVWTWATDSRKWMKGVALGALLLVIVQGVLGGLRVVWISLDLAVVHACIAQLYFSTLAAMLLFTSRFWLEASEVLEERAETTSLRRLSMATAAMVYLQIILGALLRHPGAGVDALLVSLHVLGAFVVFCLVFMLVKTARAASQGSVAPSRLAHGIAGVLILQVCLGMFALLVTFYDMGVGRSLTQVVLNTAHMVVGAVLLATLVTLVLVAARRGTAVEQPRRPASEARAG